MGRPGTGSLGNGIRWDSTGTCSEDSQMTASKPRWRRSGGKSPGVGGTPGGTSSSHPVGTALPLPPHHHPSVSASCIAPYGVGSGSQCGFVPWLGFCPAGCSRQGLGVGRSCFCVCCPLIGLSGNNEAAFATEKRPWIPGHTNCCLLTGHTDAAG